MGAGASFAHDLSLEFRFGRKQSFVSGGAQGVRAGEVNRQRRLQGLGAEKLVDGKGEASNPPPPPPLLAAQEQKGTGDVDGQ